MTLQWKICVFNNFILQCNFEYQQVSLNVDKSSTLVLFSREVRLLFPGQGYQWIHGHVLEHIHTFLQKKHLPIQLGHEKWFTSLR